MKCLIPNIGSTSFKFRALNMPEESVLAEGRVERIGQPGSECADYPAAIRKCIGAIAGPGKALASLSEIGAVGFKVVHAGHFAESQLIDDTFLAAMEEFSFLAPAHNPPYIAAIRAFRQELPGVPLVAVIETGPYRQMDEAATTYAVPYEWREQYGMRRYGFHGASHRSASERTQALLGRNNLRHISCHLGGSSSVAAFHKGIAVDTSFGASPQSGLPQNNRVGDIDVFAVLYMMKKLGLDSFKTALPSSHRPPARPEDQPAGQPQDDVDKAGERGAGSAMPMGAGQACGICGEQNDPGSAHCVECGNRLRGRGAA